MSGCSHPYANKFYVAIELRKNQFGPDKSYGNRDFSGCKYNGVQQNWGNPGSGNFFQQLHTYSYDQISASRYNVGY